MANNIFKTYEVTVDTMNDSSSYHAIRYSQSDMNSAKLLINIKHNGAEIDLSEATAVRICFRKSDRNDVFQDCQPINVLNGKYQVLLTSQTLASLGAVVAQVCIEFPNNKKLFTQTFTFIVDESLMNDETIESKNEYGVIQKAIDAGEQLKDVDVPALIASKTTAESAQAKANDTASKLGNLPGLKTTEKLRLTDSINEVYDQSQTNKTNLGDVTALQTTAKIIVPAINEAKSQAADAQSKANNPVAQILPNSIPSNLLKILNDGDKIGLANLKSEVINAMNGQSPTGTIPAVGSVTPDRTSFIIKGKNLFNKDTATSGYYVSDTNGTLTAYSGYWASDYIPVSANTQYIRSFDHRLAFYDANKTFISGLDSTKTGAFTTPANCSYLRTSISNASLNTFQLEQGATITSYVPYSLKMSGIAPDTTKIPDASIVGSVLKDNSITIEKVDFITTGKNLFNKKKVKAGYYVLDTNGTLGTYAGYSASDYIPVSPNTQYIRSFDHRLAFYDANKTFISGLDSTKTGAFTTPANCSYLRTSMPDTLLDSFQLEKGNALTAFEPFSNKLVDSISDETNTYDEVKNRLCLPSDMYFVEGETLPLYKGSIMPVISNEQSFRTTLINVDSTGLPNYRYFQDHVILKPEELQSDFKVGVKPKIDTDNFYYKQINKHSVAKEKNVGKTFNVLGIGDSLTNYDTLSLLRQKLTEFGTKPTMVGTFSQVGGELGEGRSSWQFSTFIGASNLIDSTLVITPSTSGKTTTRQQNPFLRLATSSDYSAHPDWCFRNTGAFVEKSYAQDTDKTGDFYIFDFASYLSNHSIAAPDVVTIALSTNDISLQANPIPNCRLGLEIMIKQIKAALPNVTIGIVPITPRANAAKSNALWRKSLDWLDVALKDIATYQGLYSNIYVVPIWCHMSRDWSWNYSNTDVSSTSSEQKATVTDTVHYGLSGKMEYVKAMASWYMNVI
ncbi:BppU family phage baseplate upper protein [Bacillus sp. CGMCC 1.60114]|uniref:SGNH/GDSL hydrolase family protein n=1 Tax=unclassified Bacillus (in: firmicutes) TaxID=185979 RepID=UPI0036280630